MAPPQLNRRTFITDLGKGMVAVAIFGPAIAACSSNGASDTTEPATTTTAGADPPESTTSQPQDQTTTSEAEETTTTEAETTTTTAAAAGVTVQRVSLGFVSAYVLARSGTAAIVDTGVAGSEGAIEAGLAEIGLGWGDVGDVIVTHLHPDHQGSLGPVLTNAADAVGYAGEADIAGISSPRPLTAVGDGDAVFGLEIIETPGHTAGHIAVLDPVGGILVAGDALNGAGAPVPVNSGGVGGPNPDFTPDLALAEQSVVKLAGLDFDALYFGHGEPVESGALAAVQELAATL
jgi:glyoxylase-like metal-dependent hydrolase (beta-lactamase superfamily II)